VTDFLKTFHLSWSSFVAYVPALLGGITCFILTLFAANLISKLVSKYSLRRTKDNLIANFTGKIAWSVCFILGTVLTLGILGLGTISNKILAGAGITTFVVGFALKDIGENFLAGLILAFSRPYKIGNLIECESVKGVVRDMTMRQTTIQTETGKIIMVPNSMIIKNPLIKYAHDDNNLRREFFVSIDAKKVKEASEVIRQTVHSFSVVKNSSDAPVKVIADSLSSDKIKLLVIYWLDHSTFKGSISETRSEILLAVLDQLSEKEIAFSG
jgi:small conductance mechanosensitive channel